MTEKNDADRGYWLGQHTLAFRKPTGPERGPVLLLRALEAYAEDMKEKGYTLGTDGYAEPYFRDIIKAGIKLLSLDIGRLDGGSMDTAFRSLAASNDIPSDDL